MAVRATTARNETPDGPAFSTPEEIAFGIFTAKRNGAVSAPRTEYGVLGIGYQNDSGRNCVAIGLIAVSPLLLSTGRVYVTAAVTLEFGATDAGSAISMR